MGKISVGSLAATASFLGWNLMPQKPIFKNLSTLSTAFSLKWGLILANPNILLGYFLIPS